MAFKLQDHKLALMGNHMLEYNGWNRKLCFEARDTLFACTDSAGGNKHRCPDELYAYEMWCPVDFRRIHAYKKRKDTMDAEIYDAKYLEELNADKALIKKGRWVPKAQSY